MKFLQKKKTYLLSLVLFAVGATAANAQMVREGESYRALSAAEPLQVPLYKSRVVELPAPAKRISVGNPDVADILILRSSELYVLGKDLGTTNVLLWDDGERLIATVSVEVTHDLENLKTKLHVFLPDEPIEVYAAQRSIVLSGRVSSVVKMQAALKLAETYLKQISPAKDATMFEEKSTGDAGEVINLMQVGGAQQVMLEVKVAELARSEIRKLDMRFNVLKNSSRWDTGAVNGGASFPDVVFNPETEVDPLTGLQRIIPGTGGRRPVFDGAAPWGPAIDEFAPNPLNIADTGIFASLLTSDTLFNVALDAAREKGLAKILAEPTLTTLSGQEAQFLSGGEFPIPVPRGDDGVTVEFKEFGVGVRFLPVVLNSGAINLNLNISVSELVDSNSVAITADGTVSTFLIPALSKRSANATVELSDGQTIGIAGLINENLRENINKFPGLGSIPIIGHLFRSQEFIKGETELVIMVTPHLAKPIAPDDIRLPTDDFVEPTMTEFYLMGRLEGKAPESGGGTKASGAGVATDYGHEMDSSGR